MLGCLRGSIPKLTRSSLHRCLERRKFAETAISTVHVDISELRLSQGKLNMFLAIDRVSKFTGRPSSATTPER